MIFHRFVHPHPHVGQNPSKLASNPRGNDDQGDRFLYTQNRFFVFENPPFFWMMLDDDLLIWSDFSGIEAQNLLLHLTTESCHTGDFGTGHDPGGVVVEKQPRKAWLQGRKTKSRGSVVFRSSLGRCFICFLYSFPSTQYQRIDFCWDNYRLKAFVLIVEGGGFL